MGKCRARQRRRLISIKGEVARRARTSEGIEEINTKNEGIFEDCEIKYSTEQRHANDGP